MHLTLHALAIQRQKVEHLDNEMHDEQKCNFQNEIKNFGVILPENSKFKYPGDYKSDSHEMSDRRRQIQHILFIYLGDDIPKRNYWDAIIRELNRSSGHKLSTSIN